MTVPVSLMTISKTIFGKINYYLIIYSIGSSRKVYFKYYFSQEEFLNVCIHTYVYIYKYIIQQINLCDL